MEDRTIRVGDTVKIGLLQGMVIRCYKYQGFDWVDVEIEGKVAHYPIIMVSL